MMHLGRALIGYMREEEALQTMVGRSVREDEQSALQQEWRRVRENVANRPDHESVSPLLEPPSRISSKLEEVASRSDIGNILARLEWSIGFADVSKGVVSFVRVIDTNRAATLVPRPSDEPEFLVNLCLPLSRQMMLEGAFDAAQMTFTATSMDPNLRVAGFEMARIGAEGEDARQVIGFRLNAGPSLVQLVEYNGLWMVRDGYHRLYELLRHGISRVPCVVISAGTFEETGASRPGFFSYETLFGPRPPLLTDFLDENLSVRTQIRASMRVIRLRAEEFVVPLPEEETWR